MATIHLHETTTATPEQFLAALTDFGSGRSKLFSATSDEFLKVHEQGPAFADVTEGTRSAWERLRYDWSDPHRVVMKTVDSNLWGGASGHIYTITRNAQGTTDVDAVVVREGKNAKGRVTGLLLGTVAKGALAKALANTVKAVEVRNNALPSSRR
jgi:polyketide cyclase/dehydrase/lipid transport protein